MNVKIFIRLCAIFPLIYFITQFDSHLSSKENKYLYIKKVKTTCGTANSQGHKIILLPSLRNQHFVAEPSCTYEWDKVFSGYKLEQKIELLKELLSFRDDTSRCSMPVCRYGYSKINSPRTTHYSMQIDALYLLTLLTASSYSLYYCPYPVLVDNETGQEINNDPVKMREVYSIYEEWFAENKNHNFENYNLPLRGRRYEWYGTRKDMSYMYSDTFRIKKLAASAVVIGNCRN
jgi:hypothetical protein